MTEPADPPGSAPEAAAAFRVPWAVSAPFEARRRPELVLLPGMLADARVWEPVAERLLDVASVRVARLDLDDTIADLAAGVLAEAPAEFALAGHSLGGVVALEIARRAPHRVRRLALVSCSGRGPVAAQREAWNGWRRRVEAGGFESVAAELARSNLPEPRRDDEALVALNERMGAHVGPEGLLRQLAAQQSRTGFLAELGALSVPTLVVGGELDEVCPFPLQQELASVVPGARLELLAGVGHMSPLEAPDELADLFAGWLRARASAAAPAPPDG